MLERRAVPECCAALAMLQLVHQSETLLTGALNVPPFPAELLMSYSVTPKMNRTSFNEPAAIVPLEPAIT